MTEELLPEFESAADASRITGVSAWLIRDLVRRKKLAAKKLGKRLLINVESRREFFASLPDAEFSPLKRPARVSSPREEEIA